MTGNLLSLNKKLLFSLLILGFSNASLLSQTSLSGNINQPSTYVVALSGTDRVIVDDVTGFNVNDTILLIQMQGVRILTDGTYGFLQNKMGEPGMHEFLIIQSINGGTGEIVFRNDILQTYHEGGNIQIVRVPYYNSAIITGKLFCAPWDSVSKSGGVLALIVGTTITLNADIDVSELGFKGGKDTIGEGICRNTNQILYGREYYSWSFKNAGYKGEGVANWRDELGGQPLGNNFAKGLGNNWTGGGGGNGRYSGGGGGSNRGAGGPGGMEDCSLPNFPGGNGGIIADHPSLIDRIYMGGGGGASTTSPAGTSSYGGKGGGIVIMVGEGIIGNGGDILANGSNGGSVAGIGGSGGGGAGGSIALSLNRYGSTSLGFSATGGNGGDNPAGFGEGGGGGGGLLFLSTNTTGNVTNTLNGGSSGANPGGNGQIKQGFKAILNGFLFNSISSSVTGDQIDSICSNMLPQKIIGTKPVGGNGPYTYLWEKSYDENFTSPIALVNDPDPVNYTPTLIETATVWFRRTITDSSTPIALVDVSKLVKIIVQPFIKNNIVGTSDTICFAGNPPAFTSQAVLLDGNGIYTFNWEVSLNNSLYTTPLNSHNTEGYTPPPALTITSWYRRTVTSGRCIDSATFVRITVLDTIRNNRILNSPPDICYGLTFTNLSATTATSTPSLTGGDDLYRFKWESNINGGGWGTAPGVSNSAVYNPDELPQRVPSNQYIFRRVVYSGSNDVCFSTSNAVLLTDYPVITNNNVTPGPPVCSGSIPGNITGSKAPTLAGGNGNYAYEWQDSSKSHTWTPVGGAVNADYQPPALTDTTSYRRIVFSSACSDISNSIKIIVHKPILNNSISVLTGGITQTLCNNQVPVSLQGTSATGGTNIPGDYLYQWKFSPDNSVFNSVSPGGTGIHYQPPSLTTTTYYNREVRSGACLVISNSITVTVLADITNNTISGNAKVCYSLVPGVITGPTLSGGSGIYKYLWEQSTDGGTTWTAAALTNNSHTYQAPALLAAAKYRRNVSSGLNECCTSVSNEFEIGIDPLPISPINAGPDTIIYSVEKIYHMKAINPVSPETGSWASLNNLASSIDDTTIYNTIIRNLSIGNNSFLWTIHRGPCKLKDSVNIVLLEDFIPQGFSPNSDAWNNTFIIEGLNRDDQYVDLSIVNGAGTEVFSTSNREGRTWSNWDGKNSKGLDLSEGTYYYMLKITSKRTNGPVFKKSGFIVLKRY